jgi:hypothetical protein
LETRITYNVEGHGAFTKQLSSASKDDNPQKYLLGEGITEDADGALVVFPSGATVPNVAFSI